MVSVRMRFGVLAGRASRAVLAAVCALTVLSAAAPGPAQAGRMLATGHDFDFHCAGYTEQCHFFRVSLDYVRATSPHPEKPVLVLEGLYSQLVSRSLDLAYGTGVVPRVSVDPERPEWDSVQFSTSKYSAVIVGSSIDTLSEGSTTKINARKAEIHAFFNEGGGVLAGSGDQNGDSPGDPYYQFMPIPVGGISVQAPFRLTPEGQALGFHDSPNGVGTTDDINCCVTHNSFAEPQPGSAVRVAERDFHNAAETVFAEGMVENGQIVQPQCKDGQDNDGDGLKDHPADPGCATAEDRDESNGQLPQCSDGTDNDQDAKVDMADPGCEGQNDNSETDPVTMAACSDGLDNDSDGKADFGNDPGCESRTDTDEQDPQPECMDKADNDGDGKIDWPQDPGCFVPGDPTETDYTPPRCSDTFDNDGDGEFDYPNDPGCESGSDDDEVDPTGPAAACSDGDDNDGDGLIDLEEDFGCVSADDNDETDPPECSDEFDNDLDGETDFGADPGCESADDDDEQEYWACADGEDNDSDGATDYPDDPGCAGEEDDDETDPAAKTECDDGSDNDGDGKTDFGSGANADPGCGSAADNDESDPPPATKCSNGLDDDGDGKIDFSGLNPDPGCASGADESEQDPPPATACGDGSDNDGDGKIDYPNDPDCGSLMDGSEHDSVTPMKCEDGSDNDGDGKIDHPADKGCTSPADNDEADPPPPLPACSDEQDNDKDGKIDHPADPGCASKADTDETDPAPPPPPPAKKCINGKDDDNDGKIDFGDDPGCESSDDDDETNAPVDPGPGNPGPFDPGLPPAFDSTPPDTTITSGPPSLVRGSITDATFTFTSEPGASFECRVDRPGVDWEACSSPWERFNFMPGPQAVEVRAKDLAGNVDPTPARHGWSVVSAGVSVKGLPRRCARKTIKVTVRVTDSLPVKSIELKVDRRSIGKTARRRFTTKIHTRRLKRGRHRLEVHVNDGQGNVAKRGYSFRVC